MHTAVVWFRDDLRVTDNPTLRGAVEAADEVVPVYVDDPDSYGDTRYGTQKLGSHRARFRRESLRDLRESLRERGGDLIVRQGRADEVITDLVDTVDAAGVYAQTKPATEELEVEDAVRRALPPDVQYQSHWTHTLYHVDDLPTPYHSIDDTFSPWRERVENEAEVREPVAAPDDITTPALDAGEIPPLSALGIADPPADDRRVLSFAGGETAGKARLDAYFWERDRLRAYKETRNGLLGTDYSSKFSPWLAAGCLSPRWIHAELQRYETERVANEDTYWLVFELLWRDYFQFQFMKHGADFFGPTGIRSVEKDWQRDREAFARWAAGETGVPFVDANMRELNRTGYMSNRGRQNVASFLADALGIDWRWGAAYFEEQLVDYDVASNWGNWAYQAGVGNDSRDGYFDVLSQGEYYDEDAEYVCTWLPVLADLSPEYAHRPWRMSNREQEQFGVELGVDYPEPMLDVAARYDELSGE